MVPGGEHVEDRHARRLRELLEQRVRPGAHADRRDVTRQHARGVADRLAAREVQLVAPQHDRLAAELEDPGLEGQPRARRVLLEDERDAAALERARGQRRRLQRVRAIEQGEQLVALELRPGEQMARQAGQSMATMRVLTWNLFHGRAVPPAGRDLQSEFACRARELGLGCRAVAGGSAVVAAGARARLRRRGALGADVAQRAAWRCAASSPSARPTSSGQTAAARTRSSCARRGRERSSITAACSCGAGRSGASAMPSRSRTARGSRTSTHRSTPPSVRRPTSSAPARPCSPGPAARRRCSAATSTFAIRSPPASSTSAGTASITCSGTGCAPRACREIPDRGRLSDHAPVIVTVLSQTPAPSG